MRRPSHNDADPEIHIRNKAADKETTHARGFRRRSAGRWRQGHVGQDLRYPAGVDEARLCRRGQVQGDVRALDQGPERLLGRGGQAPALVPDAEQDQERLVRARRRLDQVVRGRQPQRRLQLHRPAPGDARAADRHHLGRRRSVAIQAHHLSGAARRGLQARQYPAQPQRREGRPRHHLHADDPGGGLRHARLRAHRRDPLGGVRRLLAGIARRPHRGLRLQGRDHGRRRRARRPQGAAEGQHRRRHRQGRRRRSRHRRAPHRRRRRHGSGARRLLRQGRRGRHRRMPVRAHERGRPAVHPLHLGLDRQAEGRAAHHRRLSRLHRDDASIRVRLSRRRHLLVHRRRRLGDRPQLHRVRAARQRRHHAGVRRRAELPDHVALLGGVRQAPGQHHLHRAHRHPRADAGGRRAGEEDLAQVAAPPRHRGRADQSGGLGVVLPRRRRGPLPDRRHLVADRDRRNS